MAVPLTVSRRPESKPLKVELDWFSGTQGAANVDWTAEWVPFVTGKEGERKRGQSQCWVSTRINAQNMGGGGGGASKGHEVNVQLKTTKSPACAVTSWGWKIKLASWVVPLPPTTMVTVLAETSTTEYNWKYASVSPKELRDHTSRHPQQREPQKPRS